MSSRAVEDGWWLGGLGWDRGQNRPMFIVNPCRIYRGWVGKEAKTLQFMWNGVENSPIVINYRISRFLSRIFYCMEYKSKSEPWDSSRTRAGYSTQRPRVISAASRPKSPSKSPTKLSSSKPKPRSHSLTLPDETDSQDFRPKWKPQRIKGKNQHAEDIGDNSSWDGEKYFHGKRYFRCFSVAGAYCNDGHCSHDHTDHCGSAYRHARRLWPTRVLRATVFALRDKAYVHISLIKALKLRLNLGRG
ncbi:hypothetical protein B0H10DRAFT_1969536 [Mycena sp. CBHHK59/15]|nr:hypothetical protein B0H10DRAFT_1969536 [Mycena sp. CBHHK59/15]